MADAALDGYNWKEGRRGREEEGEGGEERGEKLSRGDECKKEGRNE